MRRFDLVVTCVCAGLIGYFAWSAFYGPRGFAHRDDLAATSAALSQKHAALRQERERLERKVALLRPESIDPDMLDELARGQLELARPSDVVAFTGR
ncbi:MAG: FtsB family cell division protein [Aestuariivirga sp.]|jgi:cell division protein FtsB|uniref:FtsB family cell division protein n=1 Tax=Aestuariivirga sp. TaxID=2650926 RepID=UPI0038D16983